MVGYRWLLKGADDKVLAIGEDPGEQEATQSCCVRIHLQFTQPVKTMSTDHLATTVL